ncbi:ABC transporter substrate-binding protein, partial [Stenotrophomonas maltophilia]|uniref:ABC transporter substrate-binding protein n=1 Tax=Stenotrophomonas maltophilia TaxID=40324 RepID=UPI0013DCFF35
VVVKPSSAIRCYADLKGKRVGVSDFGATEYPVTRNVLKTLGIDPDADVKWIAVGNGVQAGVALQRDAIDALAYYDT